MASDPFKISDDLKKQEPKKQGFMGGNRNIASNDMLKKISLMVKDKLEVPRISIPSLKTSLDEMKVFTTQNKNNYTTAEQNLEKYMECFSQEFELPSIYIQD